MLHFKTKYIDIQHYYIRDEVSIRKIELMYIVITEMIADNLIKLLMYVKFYEQMHMT